jgi:hypothetical protein
LLLQGNIERQKQTSCTTDRGEELLTSIMAILGLFLVLAVADGFTGDRLTHFPNYRYKTAVRKIFLRHNG